MTWYFSFGILLFSLSVCMILYLCLSVCVCGWELSLFVCVLCYNVLMDTHTTLHHLLIKCVRAACVLYVCIVGWHIKNIRANDTNLKFFFSFRSTGCAHIHTWKDMEISSGVVFPNLMNKFRCSLKWNMAMGWKEYYFFFRLEKRVKCDDE